MNFLSKHATIQDTYQCAPYHNCNAVTGELPSKFTALESHSYGVGYVMQMTKCIGLPSMHSMGVCCEVIKFYARNSFKISFY